MEEEYIKGDLFILPSSQEKLGISLLEAMSAGMAVITSDTAGSQWYINEGVNGYIFKSDDVNNLTEKIRLIIANKEILSTMRRKSSELATTTYSSDKFYKKFMEIVNKA